MFQVATLPFIIYLGSFLFVYSIYTQPGTNWTSWISFFVSGCLQSFLLFLCLYYDRYIIDEVVEENENTPLLT